jgi:hypothetical protein
MGMPLLGYRFFLGSKIEVQMVHTSVEVEQNCVEVKTPMKLRMSINE